MASLAVEPALDDPNLGQAEVDLRWLADVYVVVIFFLQMVCCRLSGLNHSGRLPVVPKLETKSLTSVHYDAV